MHVVNKFKNYITSYKVFVHTDHAAIRYVMNKTYVSGRIIR
jgi:hypothetical protein